MKILTCTLFLSLTIAASAQQGNGFTHQTEAGNKTVKSLKEGKWIEYFGVQNDIIVKTDKQHSIGYTITTYKAGYISGAQKYYLDGNLMTEIIHDGKGRAIYTSYYQSGKPMSETLYNKGNAGTTKNYDENGNEIK